jgi:hypothetical protein
MPHQVLRHGWNNPILLQTMIHGVSQGVKMELARRIFDILDARRFQIMAERLSGPVMPERSSQPQTKQSGYLGKFLSPAINRHTVRTLTPSRAAR